MSTFATILAVCLPVISIAAAVSVSTRTMRKSGNAAKAFKKHFVTLFVTASLCFLFALVASAADANTASAATQAAAIAGAGNATGMGFIGAALSIGLSSIGAGIALAGGAPAAIGAVSEDPKSFGKAMIFVVLGEAVALYGFVVAMLIILKIPNLPTL